MFTPPPPLPCVYSTILVQSFWSILYIIIFIWTTNTNRLSFYILNNDNILYYIELSVCCKRLTRRTQTEPWRIGISVGFVFVVLFVLCDEDVVRYCSSGLYDIIITNRVAGGIIINDHGHYNRRRSKSLGKTIFTIFYSSTARGIFPRPSFVINWFDELITNPKKFSLSGFRSGRDI